MLTAQWPLAADDSPEKRLLTVERLREKIKTGDLAGVKDAEKLSPEEQELLEEASGDENQPQFDSPFAGQNEESSPAGQPQFFFVARLPAAERDKAMADAFRKGKLRAEQLARAAGMSLGPLVELETPDSEVEFNDETGNKYPYRSNEFMTMQRAWMQNNVVTGATDQSMEVMSGSPGPATMRISVTAKFNLAPAKEGGK